MIICKAGFLGLKFLEVNNKNINYNKAGCCKYTKPENICFGLKRINYNLQFYKEAPEKKSRQS